MKYAATINDCRQYSENSWEPITRIKEITPETKLQELIDWQINIFPNNNAIQSGIHIEPMQIVKTE